LADRLCLALGQRLGVPVVTTDIAWASVNGVPEVVLIR
jgi:PIN domain nuclease of toxin-antitoxin system